MLEVVNPTEAKVCVRETWVSWQGIAGTKFRINHGEAAFASLNHANGAHSNGLLESATLAHINALPNVASGLSMSSREREGRESDRSPACGRSLQRLQALYQWAKMRHQPAHYPDGHPRLTATDKSNIWGWVWVCVRERGCVSENESVRPSE